MIVLSGHYSAETAFVVDDYPCGFKARCKIRYWLEVVQGKGTRLCTQTTNPKKAGEVWNAPKKSTYSIVGVLIQKGEEAGEENSHIGWACLSSYSSSKEIREYLEKYAAGLTETQVRGLSIGLRHSRSSNRSNKTNSIDVFPLALICKYEGWR